MMRQLSQKKAEIISSRITKYKRIQYTQIKIILIIINKFNFTKKEIRKLSPQYFSFLLFCSLFPYTSLFESCFNLLWRPRNLLFPHLNITLSF